MLAKQEANTFGFKILFEPNDMAYPLATHA
jgi:hypothetical protein